VLGTHAVAELRSQSLAPTDDSPKYTLGVPFDAVVKALWNGEAFAQSVAAGHRVGVVLDKTNFYPEQGGQIFDTGRIQLAKGESFVEVEDVQVIFSSLPSGPSPSLPPPKSKSANLLLTSG